ncbi:unnamed protein product, partial [Rotaria sp. Silwood2]
VERRQFPMGNYINEKRLTKQIHLHHELFSSHQLAFDEDFVPSVKTTDTEKRIE